MQLGLLRLGLSPGEFWTCTLREISSVFAAMPDVMSRTELEALMQALPDDGETT